VFTRPLNALLYAVLDTLIGAQTEYRLSKRIAKYTWMLQCANVMPLVALGTRARTRDHVCKSAAHHMLHAGATLDEAASNSGGHVREHTLRVIV